MISEGVGSLFGLGLPGVVIAASWWGLLFLFRRLDAVQQARIDELRQCEQALKDNTQAMNTLRSIVENLKR